jgi:protein-tyrosine phosphatase
VIDLHSHILPGIDDGPRDLEGSLALAAELAGDGVRTLAATPHLHRSFPGVEPAELPGRVEALAAELAQAGTRLELVLAGEADVLWAVEADDETLRSVSFGRRGTDLLVETPHREMPPVFEDLVFRLQLRGYRITLAHPERSAAFHAKPERLAALVAAGVLVQVTAGALTGRRGTVSRFAADLVRDGLAHVIASDAHSIGDGRARLAAGVAGAARIAPARAEWMATDAPAAILAGDPLPAAPSERRARGLARIRARGPRGSGGTSS